MSEGGGRPNSSVFVDNTHEPRLVIVGSGGHGRELAMIAHAAGFSLAGFLDDRRRDISLIERLGLSIIGPARDVAHWALYAVGIGDPGVRRRFDHIGQETGNAAILIHPSAVIGPSVDFGPGVVVFPGSVLTSHVTVGRQSHINSGSTLSHDVVLEDFVTLSPGVHLAGNVYVESGATLGTGCSVIPGVRIGADAVVGAGAVVIEDVEPGTVVAGVPARVIHKHEG
jgi:sugar O-acyltransferase (sialic acid O-acetyltransferase NeuD family)